MTSTSQHPTTAARPRKVPLIAARVVAGLVGIVQATGVGYFVLVAPEEAVWRGPAIDIPVLTLFFGGILLKLVTGLLPGLTQHRRIRLGLAAVALSVVGTLLKATLYDEPEGLTVLAADAVLLLCLVLALRRRG